MNNGRKNRDKRTRARRTRSALIGLLCILLAASAVLLTLIFQDRLKGSRPKPEKEIDHDGTRYVLRDDIETILVMGIDKTARQIRDDSSYTNEQRADFLMLLVLDKSAGNYRAIHINRDTMAQVGVLGVGGKQVRTETMQISLSHSYGSGGKDSCRNTANAVSALLCGIPVDHYASMSMSAVPVLNDLVGGVELTLLDDFHGIDPSFEKGTKVTLAGDQALRYIRGRSELEDKTNVHRMERQRQYITAFTQKAADIAREGSIGTLLNMYIKAEKYLTTDISIFEVQDLSTLIKSPKPESITELPGEVVQGEEYMEFYPDTDGVRDLVIELFYKVQ